MLLGCKLVAILFISRIYGSELISFMTITETPTTLDTIEKLDNAMKDGLKLLCIRSAASTSILLVKIAIIFCYI